MEYIDWDPALTRAATGCHIVLMERNPSVTGFRLVIDKTAHVAKPQLPPFVDYGWALEDGKLVPVLSTQPAWPQLQRPLHVAAPKTATRTVPVPGRTWPVTLDVVARDQPPSAAE